MDCLQKNLPCMWTAGGRVRIDESTIKYCRRSVKFVQFMPAKIIKHGIKMFAICCAYTGYIYVGKGAVIEGTAEAIIDRHITTADLIHEFTLLIFCSAQAFAIM